jgi:predicted phage terminase large subunit-like protein
VQISNQNKSPAEILSLLPKHARDAVLEALSDGALQDLEHSWEFLARPTQLPPGGDWRIWLVMAGRGWGKTRCGSEWVRSHVESGRAKRIGLVGRTAADVRDVMVEGPSGLIAVAAQEMRPKYEPSKRRLVWPNGAMATMFSAEEPKLLRGPQFDLGWCDELAAWKYTESFDQMMFGLRLGNDPRCIVTTTPRPVPVIRELMSNNAVVLTKGNTYENRSNLAPQFFDDIVKRYEGTALGRQEIYAEVIDEMPGALWTRELLETCRPPEVPDLVRVVVAVDPSIVGTRNETGIVVCAQGDDGKGYVLADRSTMGSPDHWARRVVQTYHEFQADRIVAEVNQGGDMVERVLRTVDEDIPYKKVRASKGKLARAEPIAAFYEQGRVFHVKHFSKLEDQMCSYVPGDTKSPDRLDALVWGLSEIMLNRKVVREYQVSDFGMRAAPWKI